MVYISHLTLLYICITMDKPSHTNDNARNTVHVHCSHLFQGKYFLFLQDSAYILVRSLLIHFYRKLAYFNSTLFVYNGNSLLLISSSPKKNLYIHICKYLFLVYSGVKMYEYFISKMNS